MTARPVEALVALHTLRDERAWMIAGCQRSAESEPCAFCERIRERWPAREAPVRRAPGGPSQAMTARAAEVVR